MTYVEGPAGRLAVDDGGAGELPVVFVHSLAGDASQWNAQLTHLRARRRAVAFDLRGHGRSDPPRNDDFTMEGLAGDVDAVAGALNLDRFVLAGHSMGGSVAIAYAGAHPDRVAGLFLVDSNGDSRKIPADVMAQFMARLNSPAYELTIGQHWDSVLKDAEVPVRLAVVAAMKRTPKDTVVRSFETMQRFDPMAWLSRYRGPVVSVISPLNQGPTALHSLTTLDVVEVPEVSHWLQMDRPEQVNALLDGFVARAERTAPDR